MQYRYKDGKFEELERDIFEEAPPKDFDDVANRAEEDFKDTLKRIGYSPLPLVKFGDEGDGWLNIFHKASYDEPWLAEIGLGSITWGWVLLETLPDMLNFLKDYGHIFTQLDVREYLMDLYELAEKAFFASHGHSWHDSCMYCDPLGYEANQRRWEESEERRRKLKEGE